MDVQPFTDDANRQQAAARAFYLVGDFLRGMDTAGRYEPGMVNDSGLLGPSASAIDIGFGSDGAVFVRGRAGQVGSTSTGTPAGQADNKAAGFTLSLPVIAVIAVVAYLALK